MAKVGHVLAKAGKVKAMSQESSKLAAQHSRAMAAKAATATAVRTGVVKPPQGRAETAAEKASTGGLVPIKKAALSLDVGPRVIHALFKDAQRLDEISKEMHLLKTVKNKQQLTELTLAIVKAAKADLNIDLSPAFSGDEKLMQKMNNQLGIALGFREVKMGDPDKYGNSYEVVVTAQAVSDCFNMPGEPTNTPEYARKKTFKSNFMTQLKKCAQAAQALIDGHIDAKYDAKAGTMLISGPTVKKHFGQERVLLDERKTVGEGDAKVELTEKPSFQALANIAAANRGIQAAQGAGGAHHRGKQTGTEGGTLAVTANKASQVTGKESIDAAILTICKSLITALEKAKELSKHAVVALEEVQNAIEVRLENEPVAS